MRPLRVQRLAPASAIGKTKLHQERHRAPVSLADAETGAVLEDHDILLALGDREPLEESVGERRPLWWFPSLPASAELARREVEIRSRLAMVEVLSFDGGQVGAGDWRLQRRLLFRAGLGPWLSCVRCAQSYATARQ